MDENDGPASTTDPSDRLSESQRQALHEVELGLEWLVRAQGHLVEFHHATGHAMDHLADAEALLRASGYDGLADQIRDHHLPRGVTAQDQWSYAVLEGFQEGLLNDVTAFERRVRDRIANGRRHVNERRQRRRWRGRAQK